jgi:hypothetical protein
MIISINNQSWGVTRLAIDYGEFVKVALKKEGWEKEWVGAWSVMEVGGVYGPYAFWVYFCYFTVGCLCQGLQGAGVVLSWWSKPVSRW